MPVLDLIDVSHWTDQSLSLHLAASLGCKGLGIKVTEGGTFVDPTAESWMERGASLGWPVILYHFVGDQAPATLQAQHFSNRVDQLRTAIPGVPVAIALDFEHGQNGDPEPSLLDSMACLLAHRPERKLVYGSDLLTSHDWTGSTVCAWALWQAEYGPALGDMPTGWTGERVLWQYTDQGVIGTVQGLDLNQFVGSTDMITWFSG